MCVCKRDRERKREIESVCERDKVCACSRSVCERVLACLIRRSLANVQRNI
jgi:hypothetical protein